MRGPGDRCGWVHRRLRRRRAADARARCRRLGQLLEVRRDRPRSDDDPGYTLVEGDARDAGLLVELLMGCDHVVAGAAHDRRHLVLPHLRLRPARDERADHRGDVRRRDRGVRRGPAAAEGDLPVQLRWCSRSATAWPSVEGDSDGVPAAGRAYGFQKLAVEYFARAASDQYGLPLHDLPSVQLRRDRRAAGRVGDVEIHAGNVTPGDEPRRARSGAEGRSRARTRCTSWGRLRRCATTPTAADLARGIVTCMTIRRR